MTAIFLNQSEITTLVYKDLDRLIKLAKQSDLKRARFCLHHTHEDLVQQMVIALIKGTRIPIHRHPDKIESFHMIQGQVKICFYDDNAKMVEKIRLSADHADGFPFLYHLSEGLWHTVTPETDVAVFHEITTGPFIENGLEILKTSQGNI